MSSLEAASPETKIKPFALFLADLARGSYKNRNKKIPISRKIKTQVE
jgi:hypothetical protein